MTNRDQGPVGDVRLRVTRWDSVHWPAVIAGIFAAVSLLVVLSVLGAAIGLSTREPADTWRSHFWGAGWWAAVSALISFAFGGWFAARTSAPADRSSGVVNGAMVWAVSVPLMVLFAGSMASIAGAGAAANPGYNRPTDQTMSAVTEEARQAGARMPGELATPQSSAVDTSAKAAWWTLISLLLGLAAAVAGGYAGGARDDINITRPGIPMA